jgi:TIR domain
MSTQLQKRANDLFISYGHADRAIVTPVVDWLSKSAGLRLWYDASSGSAAQRTTDLLSRGIESARGALFFISPNWGASTWCRDEHEVALTQRRSNDEFIVVAAQIAKVEVPTWFQTSQVLDLQQFDVASVSGLLRSLTPNPPLRFDNDQDVYYSGPWSNQSSGAKKAMRILHEMGWRFVGDSPDRPQFVDSIQRITAIIRSSRGLVAVLPFRSGSEPHHTSPWVLDEVRIAQGLGRPYVLMAEQGVVAPHELVARAYGGRVLPLSNDGLSEEFRSTLQDFDDTLGHVPLSNVGAYSFFATSLLGDATESDALVSVVERVTNMTCVRGRDLTGQHAQEAIVEQIRGAAFVIADVTDDNRNALIESGIARGTGVPLHLICRLPADSNRKTRFMLQDMEVNWYSNSLERTGVVYRIARKYRRRVFTPTIEP